MSAADHSSSMPAVIRMSQSVVPASSSNRLSMAGPASAESFFLTARIGSAARSPNEIMSRHLRYAARSPDHETDMDTRPPSHGPCAYACTHRGAMRRHTLERTLHHTWTWTWTWTYDTAVNRM